MLDYLYNAGFTKTFNEFRGEVPELVRSSRAMLKIRVVLIWYWSKVRLYTGSHVSSERVAREEMDKHYSNAAKGGRRSWLGLGCLFTISQSLGHGSGSATRPSTRRVGKCRPCRVGGFKTRQQRVDTIINAKEHACWTQGQDQRYQFSSHVLSDRLCFCRCHGEDLGLGYRGMRAYSEEPHEGRIRLHFWFNREGPRWVCFIHAVNQLFIKQFLFYSNLLWWFVYQVVECPGWLQELCYTSWPRTFDFKRTFPPWR